MVTKSKLKMALAAEKKVDFSKLYQNKARKAARKEKAKDGEGRGKKTEDEWEDVDVQSDSEDGGAAIDVDEEESEEEEDAMKVNPSSPQRAELF
jgi:rRNA-processing protein EBP2